MPQNVPCWLRKFMTPPPHASNRCLGKLDANKDPCLQNRLEKADANGISLDEVKKDPNYIVYDKPIPYKETSAASYYTDHGQGMAYCYGNGRCLKFDAYSVIPIAHRTLPLGTVLKITHFDKSITGVVADRGPYAEGKKAKNGRDVIPREFDLTKMAMHILTNGNFRRGLAIPVKVEIVAYPIQMLYHVDGALEFFKCAEYFLGAPPKPPILTPSRAITKK